MSYSQDSSEINKINEYQQDEETGETSRFFTCLRLAIYLISAVKVLC